MDESSFGRWALPLLMIALVALAAACGYSGGSPGSGEPSGAAADDDAGSDDDSGPDDDFGDDDLDDDSGDDDTWPPLPDDDTSDDDTGDDDADDDTGDDDTGDDDADDDTGDDDTNDLPFPPDDGRLYAAADAASISPTVENHPQPWYLGGAGFRIATEVHDDLMASALILAKGHEHAVIVSLDLVGYPQSRIAQIKAALADAGLDSTHVFITSTHTHESVDTMGLWGPDYFHTGRDDTYAQFVVDTVVGLVTDAWFDLVPVKIQAGVAPVADDGSNWSGLIRDSRLPTVIKSDVAAARFVDDADQTVATLVNWNTHPEVQISQAIVSSDFPHYTRQKMAELFGGTPVYVSGAVGGLQTPLGVTVPARTEAGEPELDGDNNPIYLDPGTWHKTWSLGYVVAEHAVDALDGAPLDASPDFFVRTTTIEIPVTNVMLLGALLVGLVEAPPELDRDHPWTCGLIGCLPETVGAVRVGSLVITTSPGETFPETLIGRDASSHDYGGDFGVFNYPAMTGIEEGLASEIVTMHLGLCGDETGYIVPSSDFHELDHPDFYEESYGLGWKEETVYREAMVGLLEGL